MEKSSRLAKGGEEGGRGKEDRGDPGGSRRGDRCILWRGKEGL